MPGNKIKSLEYTSAELPTIYDSERSLFMLCTNFMSWNSINLPPLHHSELHVYLPPQMCRLRPLGLFHHPQWHWPLVFQSQSYREKMIRENHFLFAQLGILHHRSKIFLASNFMSSHFKHTNISMNLNDPQSVPTQYNVSNYFLWSTFKLPRTDSSVDWTSGCHAEGREFNSGQTNTQGLKITE